MLKFPVSPEQQSELQARMHAMNVQEGDLKEDFRANGIDLVHMPTGIRIRCGKEHSQGLNRFFARLWLLEELEARQHGKTRHDMKAEKIRGDKDRRHGGKQRRDGLPDGKKTGAESIDTLGGAHLFDANGSAIGAYFLRML